MLGLVVAAGFIIIEIDPFGIFSRLGSRQASEAADEPTYVAEISPTPFLPASATPLLETGPQSLPAPAWTATVSASEPLTVTATDVRPLATDEVPVAASVAAADWWHVYFTEPQPLSESTTLSGTVAEELVDLIAAAKESIDIAAFEFNLTPVAEALIGAHQRGVAIRWITDDEHGLEADADDGRGQFKMMAQAGIPIHNDERRALMHHKFLIIDRKIVWTGSTNLTINDNFLNNNNAIVIFSNDLASIYTAQFEDMWAGDFGSRSPSDPVAQKLLIQGTPVQVLFSPEDNAISYLIPIIQGAQESVRFMAFSYTHDGLTSAMLDRAANGVDVAGIFETRGSRTTYSALGTLFCARLRVRQDGNPRTFHHKVIVVDERLLITGSLNFSDNANEPNNENTLVIVDEALAAEYLKEFERRWSEAAAPDPSRINCP